MRYTAGLKGVTVKNDGGLTTMKNITFVSTVYSVFLLFGSPTPGHASVILSLGGAVSGTGDTTTSSLGSNAPLVNSTSCTPSAAICNLEFQTLTISGAPTSAANGSYTPLDLLENFNASTDTLTVTGSIGGCAGCANLPGLSATTTLVTIVFSADLRGDATTSSFTLNTPPSVSSVTVNSTLLADMGVSSAFYLSAMTENGIAESGAGLNYYSTTNSSLALSTTATPEPASGPLAMLGLALVLFMSRKRFSKAG
jgi:hypothetical protein